MQSSIFRYSRLDAVLVAVALVQAGLVAAALSLPQRPGSRLGAAVLLGGLIAWNANTISHNHLHNPLFRSRLANRCFSLFLTLTTGVPQTLWRARHLWHHAGEPAGKRPRLGRGGVGELLLVGLLWLLLWRLWPTAFLLVYLPGFAFAMLLCQLQGHYEHDGQPVCAEPGVSYYGAAYNFLWFNDGYHAEHHRHPGAHWSRLPGRRHPPGQASQSALPPLLRFLAPLRAAANRWQAAALVALEQLALRPGAVQRFMLRTHGRALERLLRAAAPLLPPPPALRIGIVGGGLFPRTALLLSRLVPQAHLTIVDDCPRHVALARATLLAAGVAPARLTLRVERFAPERHRDFDLLIFPLGFVGDRDALYRPLPGEPPRLIHDWLWRRRGARSVVISLWLAKRLSLVAP